MTAQDEPAAEVTAARLQAVYRCFSANGQLLYVGTTGNLGRRLADHAQKVWFLDVYGITFEWHPDEVRAREAERRAIQIERPKYNVVFRDAGPDLKPTRKRAPSRVVVLAETTRRRPPDPAAGRVLLMRLVDAAPLTGITPRKLKAESGFGNTFVHEFLSEMTDRGAVVRVGRGRYRSTGSAIQ